MTDHDSSTHDSGRQGSDQPMTPETILELVNSWEEIGDQWIAEAKKKANQLRDAANQYVATTLSNLDEEEQRWLASLLYWNSNKYIRAETIAQAVGIKSGQSVCRWVYPQVIETMCACGRSFKSPYSSRGSIIPEYSSCPHCREQRMNQLREVAEQRQQEIQSLRALPYSEYLKTDHWQQVRTAALKRAGYRCQVCNTNEKSLHVHHRTYEHRGQEYARDVIVLCADCHRLFHESGQLAG